MVECLLVVVAFFVGAVAGWRSRGRWDRELRDFSNVHGD